MRSISVTIIATLLLFHNLASAQDGTSCNTPRKARGNCQNIRTCEPLLKILREFGNSAGDFLRQSVCGYDDRDPLVCCPFDGNDQRNNDGGGNNNNDNNNNNNNDNNDRNDNGNSGGETNSSYGPLLEPVCGVPNATLPRVVGGVPTELGAWPWATVLGYRSKRNSNAPLWLCGGSLISARHVLTAGHCVHERNDLFLARLGELDLETDDDGASPIDILIEKKTVHPQYSPTTYVNDIAVLRLRQDVQFTRLIRPICLPVVEKILKKDLVGKFPFLVGWGSTSFHGPSASRLQQLQVPVQSMERCKDAFKKFAIATIDDRVICAGFAQGGKDACRGDSGGPLMFPIRKAFYVVGVVSYGFKCAEPGYPGVYTKVTSFLDFVLPLLK